MRSAPFIGLSYAWRRCPPSLCARGAAQVHGRRPLMPGCLAWRLSSSAPAWVPRLPRRSPPSVPGPGGGGAYAPGTSVRAGAQSSLHRPQGRRGTQSRDPVGWRARGPAVSSRAQGRVPGSAGFPGLFRELRRLRLRGFRGGWPSSAWHRCFPPLSPRAGRFPGTWHFPARC